MNMIYTYGITQQGTYHVKHDLICQDAHNIIKCDDAFVVAAVADGLGSEEHSDIASKMASEISTEYCADNINNESSDEQILDVIRDSFALAQSRIEQVATENGHELDQYDTTLSLAVYKDDTLYYGQSGDSGIVALTADGIYKKVVEQQRDEEGRVFPLYFGDDKWVFGKFPEPVVSVLLATDGMFETLFPVYIQNEPVSIYVALARYFMGPDSLQIEESGEEYVKEKVAEFMGSIPDAQVNDDKTVVVLVNPSHDMKLQSPEYYAEPNWDELRKRYEENWRREAYPHLFKDEEKTEEIKDETMKNEKSEKCESVISTDGVLENDSETFEEETTEITDVWDGVEEDESNKDSSEQSAEQKIGKGTFRKIFSKADKKKI